MPAQLQDAAPETWTYNHARAAVTEWEAEGSESTLERIRRGFEALEALRSEGVALTDEQAKVYLACAVTLSDVPRDRRRTTQRPIAN